MTAVLDDGRLVRLERDELGADRFGYGYGLTVHRSQGLTTEVGRQPRDVTARPRSGDAYEHEYGTGQLRR